MFIDNYRYALHVSNAEFGHEIVQCVTDLEHLNRIYSNPTHDKHQWLLLQFIVLLKMDAKGVRNMYSLLVVVNKHNPARVASCWVIIYYRLVMHGNANIKFMVRLVLVSVTTKRKIKTMVRSYYVIFVNGLECLNWMCGWCLCE